MTHGPFYHVTQNEKEMCEVCQQQREQEHQTFDPEIARKMMLINRLRFNFRTNRDQVGMGFFRALYWAWIHSTRSI